MHFISYSSVPFSYCAQMLFILMFLIHQFWIQLSKGKHISLICNFQLLLEIKLSSSGENPFGKCKNLISLCVGYFVILLKAGLSIFSVIRSAAQLFTKSKEHHYSQDWKHEMFFFFFTLTYSHLLWSPYILQ